MNVTYTFEDAKTICKKYYATKCGECPIRPECTSSIPWGAEALKAWENKVIKAAGNVLSIAN